MLRALLLALTLLQVSRAGAETLQDAFNAAMQADKSIMAERDRARAADERLASARGLRLPTLNAQGAYFHLDRPPQAVVQIPMLGYLDAPLIDNDVATYQITARLPLFTGGRIAGAIQAASAASEGARESELVVAEDLKLSVSRAYINVLRARRAQHLAVTSVETLEAHARDADAFYAKGLVARNDSLAANVALAGARQDQLRASNAVDLAQAAYNRHVGRPLESKVDIEEIELGAGSDELARLTSEALQTRQELHVLDSQSRALRQQAVSTRGEQLPQIAISGGRFYLDDRYLADHGFWAVGVGISWTLFDGGVARHQARALESEARACLEARQDAESAIRLQVRQSWLDIEETRQRVSVAGQALEQAQENLRVARDRYTSGVGTNTEVLDAQALRHKSETNYIDATYDNVLAQLVLRRAVGTL